MGLAQDGEQGSSMEIFYQSEGGSFLNITGFHIKNSYPWTIRKNIDKFIENGYLDNVINQIKEEEREECDCPDCKAEREQRGGVDAVSNQSIHPGMGFNLPDEDEED
jgi:hypothetical protein